MKHRERVLCAVNHKEPDRVPLDLWGSDSRITDELYFKIIKFLGFEGYGEKERPGKTAQYVDYRISDYLDCDFRHAVIGAPKNFKKYIDNNGNTIDEWGVGTKLVGKYPQVTYHPFYNASIDDIENHKWPVTDDPGRIDGVVERVENWHKNYDYSITAATIISGFIAEQYQYLRGMNEFFTDLYLNEKFAHSLINKIADVLSELYVFFVKPIGKYIDWIEFASDFGMQDRLIMSGETFRKFYKEPMKRVFDNVRKAASEAKIFLHSCGSVRELIPDFIDMGVEIISSVQPLAKDMDSFELKKEFGKDLVFHGGIDIQRALTGSREQTIYETKKRIKDYAQGGGYICGPSNHFQPDIPVENFFALYEAARTYGKYPVNIYL